MNGRPFLAGKFGQSFRKRLMGEHLGILDINSERIAVALEGLDLDDPISEKFWTNFKATAVKNTQIHDEVFKCYPSDNVKNWEDLKRYKLEAQQSVPAVTDRRRAEKLLAGLQGFLVEFPTKFMDGVNLAPDKGLIPDAWQYPVT
uniref:Uncharacterized protein n=1 Tax=Romanomermis culicivorax TaxID=13658 RepID=A0A915HJC1_ROMCU